MRRIDPEFFSEILSAKERVVIEARRAEVRVAGGKTAFQLVAVGLNDPFRVKFAFAVFQTPFDEGPKLPRFISTGSNERVARRAVRDHRRVAAIPGAVPDIGSFRDDRRRDRFVLVVHEPREMHVRVQRTFVSRRIFHEGKERVRVFRLVVRPNRRVVGFAAGTVHQPARRSKDAFARANFGEGKGGVQDRLRRLQHELIPHRPDKFGTRRLFRVEIKGQFGFALPFAISLNGVVEVRAPPRFKRRRSGV